MFILLSLEGSLQSPSSNRAASSSETTCVCRSKHDKLRPASDFLTEKKNDPSPKHAFHVGNEQLCRPEFVPGIPEKAERTFD